MKTEKTNRIVETCKSLLEKHPKWRSFVLAKAAKFLQESGMGLAEVAEALYSSEGCDAGLVDVARALHSSEGCNASLAEVAWALYRGCDAGLAEVAGALYSSEGCNADIEETTAAITPLGSESGVKQAIEFLSGVVDAEERKEIKDAFKSCQT